MIEFNEPMQDETKVIKFEEKKNSETESSFGIDLSNN